MNQGWSDGSGPSTIPESLYRAAENFPDEEAIVDSDVRLTFAELSEEASSIAQALLAAGISPGDRIAIWAANSARWITTSFAIYLVGAVLVPVNTRFKGEEAAHVLRRSGSRLLFGSTDVLGHDLFDLLEGIDLPALEQMIVMAGPDRAGAITWDAFVRRPSSGVTSGKQLPKVSPEDLSDIIFTSGTTGSPKGAMLTHGASVRTYLAWTDAVGLRRGDRYLCVYPFFHTAGLKSVILACVLRGATILPQAIFDAGTVMERVVNERITVLPGPPTVFQSILEHPDRHAFDLSTLRLSVTGAATVPVEVIRRMREDLRIGTVVTGYGLTETTGTVSMCRYDDPPDVIANTVGTPLDGVEVKVLDDTDRTVPIGEPGEILVRGFNVMLGYFDDKEATADAIDGDGWLRTGDIGYVGTDGNLRITDRKKDMFIVGGFNAFPAEIEGILLTHPGVAQVAVVGIPDDRLGEVGQAYVVPRAGPEFDQASLISWCREHMANYKVPRRVIVVEELPQTASGKVQRFRLRDTATPSYRP
jgi:acyl-CoA synthetase (AMP-forming)/AMP-acid ligase II